MTNTISSLLSLLFIVIIITLSISCNRNNNKTETKTSNTATDTLNQTNDSLENDTLVKDNLSEKIQEDSIAVEVGDSLKNEAIALKENSEIKKADKKESAASNENKSASNFKENINQQETKSSGGIKAANNIKDVLNENKPKGRTIIIGSGGGVTGAVTTYKIYEDGSLFESNSLSVNVAQKKLKVLADAKAIQSQFDALNIDDIKLNAPGNIYFFVAYEKAGKSHRCTWGANDVQAPESLRAFYDNLMKTISENK